MNTFAIADTGATDHFMTSSYPLTDIATTDTAISVAMPNGATIQSTHQGRLPLPAPINMKAHVLPDLSHSLISIGRLCDAGCTATFDADKVVIHHQNQPVLTGPRDPNGLWSLGTAPNYTKPQANFTVHDAVSRDIIKFFHLALFSPTKSTLLKAIQNNHFIGWPGLTERNVKRHLQLEEPTIMGHMDQQRQGTRSTKGGTAPPPEATQDLMEELNVETLDARTHATYFSIQDLPTGRVFTDQTGTFPVVSSQGTKAVMILYDYDSNAILTEGITSRGKTELQRAYAALFSRLQQAGLKPQIHRMDNEISEVVKQFLRQQQVQLELTPAHLHRRNAAERAIRTWKNHFLAGLASLNPRFPLRFWSYLLPQAEITLNLLRQSRLNPRLSAYAQLFGNYDFNRTPMAPPGCEIIAFQPPGIRPSWGFHGTKAWYTRPAIQHYRCVHAITASTGRETTVETLQFLPHNFRAPTLSPTELATIAAHNLTKAIQQLRTTPRTKDHLTAADMQNLTNLSNIYAAMYPTLEPSHSETDTSPRVPTAAEPPLRVPITPDPSNMPLAVPTQQMDNPQAGHSRISPPLADINEVILQPPPSDTPMQYAYAVHDPDSGQMLEYRHLIRHPKLKHIWLKAGANEFGRLAQGIRDIPGTDTITFISKSELPPNKRPTYARFVADIRPQKEEQHRVRLTIGGNLIQYDGDVSSPTGSLTTYKMHCNDIISTPGARALCLDIENYYLNTPLPSPEFMKVHISLIPEEIIQHYNLWDLVDADGYIYIRLNKGMYGLPQAGILAYNLLVKRLAPHGYAPVRHTPGLWRHNRKQTSFVLVVDDFSVKYLNQQDANEFLNLLRTWYSIKVDWEAKLYCGITTEWDYANRHVTMSMPGYINTFLKEINHPLPRKPQHAPHPYQPIAYGKDAQLAEAPDETEPLAPTDPIKPAQIIGKLLYYARAVDCTLSVALSSLATEQNKPTLKTKQKLIQLLDYCATYPNARLRYHASDMRLYVHSDAGYNNETGARSRAGGHIYLGNGPNKPPLPNGAVLNPTHIIKHVAPSAAEAEIAAASITCKEAIPLRLTLQEMGYPQPATPVTLDNTTTVNFITKQLKQRRTKAMDMRYYWLQDQEAQQHFTFMWDKGANNKADYFTKHHAPGHHQAVRSQYIMTCHQAPPRSAALLLRGCADPSHFQEQPGGQTVTVRDPAGVNPAGALTATHLITDHLTVD